MPVPHEVTVSSASHPGLPPGRVTAVRHAVDGVRVEVRFSKSTAPALPVGRAGELRFERAIDGAQPVAMGALGKVASRRDSGGERVYECLFSGRTRESLSRLLEPRRHQRIYPDPAEPVLVTLVVHGTDGGIVGPARDVSTSGIGIELPWAHEMTLCQVEVTQVRVQLPNAEGEHVFEGRIRNRSLGEGSIVYGVSFLTDDAENADPRFEALAAYVRSREDESGAGALGEAPVRRSA